ncbi:MAG TPA: hypothetical protein VF278_16520 [Pirellulales bacterium]
MATPRIRKYATVKELETLIDDYITQGYEVISQGQTSTMLRKKSWGSATGHVLWALLIFWFTLGIGNAVYALVAHNSAEQVLLKLDQA